MKRWLFRFCRGYTRNVVVTTALLIGFGVADAQTSQSPLANQSQTHVDAVDEAMTDGVAAYRQGALDSAAESWQRAAELYQADQRTADQIDAMRNLASALRGLGRYRLALEQLGSASEIARQLADRPRTIALRSDLGAMLTLTRRFDLAATTLDDALSMAGQDDDRHIQAMILNNLGNLLAAQQQHQAALERYKRCAALAHDQRDPQLQARALTNAAMMVQKASDTAIDGQARALNHQAINLLKGLDASHDKAYLMIAAGRNAHRLLSDAQDDQADDRVGLLKEVHDAYRTAFAVAKNIDDKRAGSFALGRIAQLYEFEGREEEALRLTRQAGLMAQQVQANDVLYRWQWQTGRLLGDLGRIDSAIASCQQAVNTLESVRQDVAIGHGNRQLGASFREDVGPLFYDLAQLLLARADIASNPQQAQTDLLAARDAIEQFKSAELIDYFQDECVGLLRAKATQVEDISAQSAVIYLIPLVDRTELLVSFHDGLKRFTVPVGNEELTRQVKGFRYELENLSTRMHMAYAKQLYDWLIDPLEPDLQSRAIDTLVFVPDGSLRLIPLAALHDGRQFLAQRYATAITPGLTLMEASRLADSQIQLLACGLSVSPHPDLAPLMYVPEELEEIVKMFEGVGLLDQQFLLSRLEQEVRDRQYSVVHIASHGHFGANADDTFVWAYDHKLTLGGLERLIRPVRFRDQPLELLVLSACQTAAGDDRAALGLAGIALKAGARSAVATLWPIHDRATSLLVRAFYEQIRADPTVSKAKALQRARIHFINNREYNDPFYWSPFLVIGNWR